MAKLHSNESSVQVGDRFIKVGAQLQKVWQVARLLKPVDGIIHACLDYRGDTMTISVRTLQDRHFFTPVPSSSQG